MLTARTGGAEGVNAQILHVQRKVYLLCLRHYRHGGGGGVDAALGLGLRHTLYPVHPALVLEAVIRTCAVHRDDGFLYAAKLRLVQVEHFQRPAAVLGVHGVHPQQTVGKQGGFLAAGTAADLHDDVFAIVHVLGQQQNFEIIFQLCHILTFFADFLLYHLLEVRVKCSGLLQQSFGLRQMIQRGLPVPVSLHHRLGVVILPHQFAEQCRVGGGIGLVQPHGKLLKAAADRIHPGRNILHPCSSPYKFVPVRVRWLRYCALPGFITFLMFFSILARGSMTSRPQPVQRILKSMPTRSTSKLDAPQGCFLRVRMVSPTAMSIFIRPLPSFLPRRRPAEPVCAAARIAGAAHTDIV